MAPPFYTFVVAASLLVGVASGPEPSHPLAIGGLGVATVLSGIWLGAEVIPALPLERWASAVSLPAWSLPSLPARFLPRWWLAGLILPAAVGVAWGIIRGGGSRTPPTEEDLSLENLPSFPSHLGLFFVLVGLAGILFAGFTFFQRVAIVAPVFEELLKFGLALAVFSSLGIAGLLGRGSLGLLSGVAFGYAEHVLSYPSESDLLFVSRVAFHASVTIMSVVVYTTLERQAPGEPRLRFASTALPTLLHMSNNLMAVVMGLVGATVETSGLTFIAAPLGLMVAAVALVVCVAIARNPQETVDATRTLVADLQ